MTVLETAGMIAFGVLGIATAANWLRSRDPAGGFLALAIILMSAVTLLGRLPSLIHFTSPLLNPIEVVLFMASGYALFRYRGSLLSLPRRWHVATVSAMAAASGAYIAVQARGANHAVLAGVALILVVVWSASVGEAVVRFWLVARHLASVQAWRLRMLSLGFGGLIVVLAFAVSVGTLAVQPFVQLVTGVVLLGIVPLLYVSFSPPAWLRREWRASEEAGLRAFMEDLLIADKHAALMGPALDWALRLVGGEGAVLFDGAGKVDGSRGIESAELDELADQLPHLAQGITRVRLGAADRMLLVLSAGGRTDAGTLIILAGPFTPSFGADEVQRARQFTSAFLTALDRRRLIAALEESNARLTEASHHKSQFMANMSHELRTPLNAIIGFSELLTDAADGQFDAATRRRFVTQILTAGRHLLGLINDILDLSKVEAGQMELHLQTVAVADLVDQVATTVEPLVAKKQIRLETDAAQAGDVTADPGKLKQMLLNLVSNAIKFTPEGGLVAIHAARTSKSLEISVRDTGIGISDADQGQIFKEFHQVDSGPGRRQEGTGLGLALTRRFALLHGGDVRLRSKVDEGSVFTLALPLVRVAPEPAKTAGFAAVLNGKGSGPLVLVVEDDGGAAELLIRELAAAGYRTELARTGPEALVKARQLQPAAITLDVILPELDGWEVMSRLKSDGATSAIPIVVVSVVDNPELGLALGAIDYLVKPVDGKDLVTRLKRFAANRSERIAQIRVLIVDDEAANREWLTETLEPAGFRVLSASGGEQAINMARLHKPDLILLDLMMPNVTGFDVVETLREHRETCDIPIMILTAAMLTAEEKRKLNGRVAQILSRGSVGASDIVGLLRRTVARESGAA
jgi:signal transduction histidine kinase/CheY-like chemotaxis protein